MVVSLRTVSTPVFCRSRIDDLFDQVGGIESRPALPRKPGKGASMEEHFGSEVHMRGSHASISCCHEVRRWCPG